MYGRSNVDRDRIIHLLQQGVPGIVVASRLGVSRATVSKVSREVFGEMPRTEKNSQQTPAGKPQRNACRNNR